MTAIRGLLALPVIVIAIFLYWMADGLAKLSQAMGDLATRIAEPCRP
jgi:hypothetical protein